MTANRDNFVNVPNVLLLLWLLGDAVYHACFAFHIVGWKNFNLCAAASAIVLTMYASTDAAREYNGNRFMIRHKQWFLPGFFATLVMVLVVGYVLKGTSYQTVFLGLLLVSIDLFIAGIIVFSPRHTIRPNI